ncbi:MAG: multiheme c-type cytochrome [Chloroflexi bacterium]|nr:multiheme c-type cytochrome [Chloroflexota bacterium]
MKLLKRFSIAILFALLVTAATYMIAQANTGASKPAAQQQQPACSVCHSKFNDAWLSGKHGHSTSDPLFNQMWTDQGKPGACLVCHVTGYDPALGTWKEDGVSCEACHGPVPANHTTDPVANPVPVDRTSDLCGRCHSGDRFNIQDWQSSTHFQRGMTCTVCHDPHSATLKTVQGQEDVGPSALCINCHSEVSMAFPYSKHNQAGVSCVDCHLRHFETGTTDVHAMPDHSFTASIATCSACHADQMHAQPTETTTTQSTTPTIQTQSTPTSSEVSGIPSPVSPLGFAGLAGLIGLAGGMVLQPWLEKAYHKMNRKGNKK